MNECFSFNNRRFREGRLKAVFQTAFVNLEING